MKKKMYPINVSTDKNGNVSLLQEWNDPNEPDPEIMISSEQAGLVSSWILDAASEVNEQTQEVESIPVTFFSNGPDSELENMKIYNNESGMVIISINDDTFIEVSPAMAKRMREQLSKAISTAFTHMLLSDDEV